MVMINKINLQWYLRIRRLPRNINEITSPFNLYNENGYLVDQKRQNSLAKDVLETWYEENIISADFENLIYDTDFAMIMNIQKMKQLSSIPYTLKTEKLNFKM